MVLYRRFDGGGDGYRRGRELNNQVCIWYNGRRIKKKILKKCYFDFTKKREIIKYRLGRRMIGKETNDMGGVEGWEEEEWEEWEEREERDGGV